MTAVTPPLSRRRALLELVGVCGLALTQPLLDVMGRAADYFVLRGAGALQIVAFALLVATVPALVLWSVELVVRAVGPRFHRPVHLGFIGLLTTVFVVQLLHEHITNGLVWVAGAAVGAVVVFAYRRFEAVRLWLAFLAFAPIGFVALFLLSSPTAHLLQRDPPAADVEVKAPAPVFMVVLDELPVSMLMGGDGKIDRELFPNLAALADRSHWYRNATSVAPSTYHAVPAILTGDLSDDGDGPSAADHPDSLFTLLGGSYDMHVEEVITRVCPGALCERPSSWTVLGDLAADARDAMGTRLGVGTRRDPIAALGAASDPVGTFEQFVDEMDADPQTLHVLHLMLPHRPWRYLPDARTYDDPVPDIGMDPIFQVWSDEAWPSTLARQRMLLQAQLLDHLLGDAFDRLRDLGLYDDSVIVVTADHGVSFDPGTVARPIFGEPLSRTSTTDLLWVPLFVKEPGQTKGEVSDANALTVDVVPTIADILGVDIPWSVDGRSLLGEPRATADKPWRPTKVSTSSASVGEEVTVDGDVGLADLFHRTLDEWLSPAGTPNRVWEIGPHRELVGRRAADQGAALSPVAAHLHEADGDADTGALVRADVPDLQPGDAVAVAVDGTVAASGTVFLQDGKPQVAVMVPPERLESGRGVVSIYRIAP
jgi:hypothetical protein